MYTLLNANYTVTCAEICEDSSLIAIGFSDSSIKVWSLSHIKLREMKTADILKEIDRDADDVLIRKLDDRKAETSPMLYGHSGPVYRTASSPDRTMLRSCSEDRSKSNATNSVSAPKWKSWKRIQIHSGYAVWNLRNHDSGDELTDEKTVPEVGYTLDTQESFSLVSSFVVGWEGSQVVGQSAILYVLKCNVCCNHTLAQFQLHKTVLNGTKARILHWLKMT
ncbi:transcription initiation factor TFIID subunit 5-like [Armigeres subalbatus]|uniref:transcription initiation factor TFIID subunit 5-like n=1 Tax=Armigeres subalbatus TaxID=124917 RepID=UPI002ED05526